MTNVQFELDRKADKLVDVCRREAWDEFRPYLMKTFNEIRNEALEEAAIKLSTEGDRLRSIPNDYFGAARMVRTMKDTACGIGVGGK